MKIPQLNRLSTASQLSLLAVVILMGAVLFTVNSALQQKNEGIHASGAANMLLNASFESGTSPWVFNQTSPGAGTFTTTTSQHEDGASAAQINITGTSTNSWYVQIGQAGMSVQSGQPYTVTFWAKASASRPIEAVVQQSNSPWAVYRDTKYTATTSWQPYSFTFTPQTTQSNVSVNFNLAQATGQVWIDNVSYSTGSSAPTTQPVSTVTTQSVSPFSGYGFVAPVTINNTGNTNTLTGYQVAVTLNTASLISAGQMRSDCGDTRFTASDGTLLNYYLASGCNTGNTTYWVKVPTIAASSNTTIYLNYSNPSATSASSGRNTFNIFEDMSTAPIGTLKGNAIYDGTNKWVRMTTATNFTNGALEYTTGNIGLNPNDGYVADYQEWAGASTTTSGSPADATYLYAYDTSTPTDEEGGHGGYLYANDEFEKQEQLQFNGTNLVNYSRTNIGDGSWHAVAITYLPYESTVVFDGHVDIDFSDTSRSVTGTLFGFGARTGNTNNEHRIRAIQVRKYTSPAPVTSVGAVITPAPTLVAAPTPTSTPTLTPTQTPSTAPSSSPSNAPTQVVQPTISFAPGDTIISLTVGLHGIGTGGDSANPNSDGNMKPLHTARTVSVDIYDAQNQLVMNQLGTINYNSSTGKFTGSIDLGSSFATGLYTVKVKTDQYLRALVPGIQTITQGQTANLPTVYLVAGDISGNNTIDIVDYNILIGCYSDLLPPTNPACTPGSANFELSDLNDDGSVNQFDYNLFLRELTNIGGQ